jgi:hypothetical protein
LLLCADETQNKNKKEEDKKFDDIDWQAVVLDFQAVHKLFEQEELRKEWERKDLENILTLRDLQEVGRVFQLLSAYQRSDPGREGVVSASSTEFHRPN